ncbi:IclR family transcriptional regulator [Rhizohabitans arisaemae]|uniref:IclR family transcriptional regulator n=1 Tax=Rhizohabitans arisaemae TaxID=2720610 RepID=UPI0024B0BFE2|nr:IclR family transcriptional regulator [Rhizohabitans arisaemae]
MENRPPYPLNSVDNALRLLQMLRDQESLRVSEAAEELGTARSTAHRLLAMLVYRGFAVQDESRGYLPGPALSAPRIPAAPPLRRLRRALLPHMDALCDRVGETVNFMVRVGTQTRFLATVESPQVLHVGDRQGTILPASLSSGGLALLAELSDAELAELYLADEAEPPAGRLASAKTDASPKMPAADFQRFRDSLRAVRRRGYALNLEATEAGICAVGMCVADRSGQVVGALSIAVPTPRFAKDRIVALAAELRFTIDRAKADLDALAP